MAMPFHVFPRAVLRLRPVTAALLALAAGGAQAATFTVINTDDDGPGSLRQTVADASAAPGSHTIVFDLNGKSSIVLTSGQILIENTQLTIDGPGREWLGISGNHASRVFDIQGASQVTLRNLTLRDGRPEQGTELADVAGGAVRVGFMDFDDWLCLDKPGSGPDPDAAHLVLAGVDIIDSQSGPFVADEGTGMGGAVSVGQGSSLTATDSRLRDNRSTRSGGGVYAHGAYLTLIDTEISGNVVEAHAGNPAGGAIFAYCSGLDITRGVIHDNVLRGEPTLNPSPVAPLGAGLMINPPSQPIRIVSTQISGNTWPGDSAAVGGGIYCDDFSIDGPHEFALINSTISGNVETGVGKGSYGPGVATTCATRISNSTITGNGVPLADSSAALGVIDYGDGTSLTLESTLIASNEGDDIAYFSEVDPDQELEVQGSHNLIGSPSVGVILPPDTMFGVDPLLGPLASNGGRTGTHALLEGSPAIDAGNNPHGLFHDQRGLGFERAIGAAADIGAFESGSDTVFRHDFEMPAKK